MRPAAALTAALAAAAVLAGCGGTHTSEQATTTAPPATTSAAEVTAQAAARYARWAATWNAVQSADLHRVDGRCTTGAAWAPCADAWTQFGRHYAASMNALARLDMPAAVARERDLMVRHGVHVSAAAGDMAAATSALAQIDARRALTAALADVGGDAQVIRAHLGLPPAKPIG